MRRCLLLGAAIALLTLDLADAARARAGADLEADELLLHRSGIPTDGAGLLDFFRSPSMDVALLIHQLGDDAFTTRERAAYRLIVLGPRARPALQEALKADDPEVVSRARECIEQIERGMNTEILAAAVRLLAQLHPAGSTEVLLAYLPSAEVDGVTSDVRAALEVVAVHKGKVDPALLAALTDSNPVKRAIAGAAIARCGGTEYRAAVHKLAADADPRVRLRVGLALTSAGDKAGIPALIGVLDQLGTDDAGAVEDLLLRLAGESAPAELVGEDALARRRYREAWEGWWKEHEQQTTAAKLSQATRALGHTLVVLLDLGEVVYLDANNREQWKIGGLSLPLDVQLLRGGQRILVAEHDANRVTERDLKGEIKWEFREEECLAAQRLANGNTFIASRRRLLEVDKDGKEVFSYTRPEGAAFMKAKKLANGDVACVTTLTGSRFIRLSPSGKDFREINSFQVFVSTSGGRIDVLPNGHVLVPEMQTNRVVEYDADGREIRALAVEQPVAAVYLPNGHVVATSANMLQRRGRAVEFDRSGKEVWQYKRDDSRVTRALRQ